MSTWILGIDIAKATFEVALRTEEGVCATAGFENTPKGFRSLLKWLTKQKVGTVHACMEATGRYGDALAAFLYEHGCAVSVVNPARIRHYALSKLSRAKTDKQDAKLIADFCLTQQPDLWQPLSPLRSELQALTRHLSALKQTRQQELNRRKSGNPSASVRKAIDKHIGFLDKQIEQLEKEIAQLSKQDAEQNKLMKLAQTIVGVGPLTAATFLAEVPDINRFAQTSQLDAYAGLCPTQNESGSSVRKKSRLAKSGNSRLRAALYFPALCAMQHNPIVKNLVKRLEARGKSRMTIVAAAMRKLLHLIYGVLKTGKPFDPMYSNPPLAT